jgi:hypothetical protein
MWVEVFDSAFLTATTNLAATPSARWMVEDAGNGKIGL